LNIVYFLITQQERQVFGDQSKTMITTSKGGYYKNNTTTYGMVGGYGRGSYIILCAYKPFAIQTTKIIIHI